jgi:hypothetical protein
MKNGEFRRRLRKRWQDTNTNARWPRPRDRPHPEQSIREVLQAILENAVSALMSSAVVNKQEDFNSPSTSLAMS